jgi:hypothetical protein
MIAESKVFNYVMIVMMTKEGALAMINIGL